MFDYKLFFDLSPDLLCIAGYDGYFKKVNPAVSALLGYSEQELYARPINDFVFDDDKKVTNEARHNLTRSSTLFNFENRYVTKEGDTVWLAWTSKPVEEERLIFAIAKNVTHKKRLEIERLALLSDLTQLNEDLKSFTLTTSHDLRSPLSNLTMVFELLDISKISDTETVQLIEILRSTGENLHRHMDSYVDILSEKFGNQSKLEEVELEESLNKVLQSISSLIRTSNTVVSYNFDEASKVIFNKSYMESVFLNLITNAIKYSKSSLPPEISIYSCKHDDSIRLVITDNGIGFDMDEVRGRLFGMNQTFHDHRDSKGIGLYLVHRHITSLGGTIAVESAINEGTRFTISFKA